MQNKTLVAKTLHGLEEVLAAEIKSIGGTDISILKRAVSFKGDKELLYKSNIWLRTALRILYPIREFTFRTQDDFYKQIKKIAWDSYMSHDGTLAIDAVVNSKIFNHSKYVALLAKDAVVDYFKNNYGIRPNVDTKRPDLRIHVHISENKCNLSLDSSGDPLFMRGYRNGKHETPLNEVLAAGMVLLSGWDKKSTFVDPMCGTGTLGIEAAMIAHNVPPSIIREHFAFLNWKDYDEELFLRLRRQNWDIAESPQIICSDISPVYSRMAKAAAKRLGIGNAVKCFTKDFEKLNFIEEKGEGMIMMNPPYGERIEIEDIMDLYSMIGSRLKHEWPGYNSWVLTN
ncbi:MAG: THUMP domain-containing protein, partial [Bacteroidota bacterium]|nr:THUMP domain-containing protein [Bacteroidota bacterium]